MDTKIERFFTFIMKEKTRNFFAFVFYVWSIVMLLEINLPLVLSIILFVAQMIIAIFACTIYMAEWMDKTFERGIVELGKNITKEIKKIAKEIVMFIPVLLMCACINSFIMVGQPVNQTRIVEAFNEALIINSISAIIISPIMEEFIFRFLPHRFIQRKTLYIIISAVVFAAMHVVNDPNPFYYIWAYMIRALYYGYRYYKTKDIWVTISLHSFNNLIATALIILSYF